MKRKLTFYLVCALFLIMFTLAGCGGGGETETPESRSTESPLPTPDLAPDVSSPIQTPSPGRLPDWDAEPEPGKAIIRGRVDIPSFVLLGELFLAKAVPTSNPDIDLLELDEENDPRASLNHDTGEFVFVNVEPGKYGVIALEPMGAAPLSDLETGETFFVEFLADQVVDIGILYYP